MNKKTDISLDDYTVFRLLCELEGGGILSQRDLSRLLNNALGLVNAYLKACIAKGWVRVKDISGTRKLYLVTPKGVAERRRIACCQLRYMDEMLSVVTDAYRLACDQLTAEGVEKVACCGLETTTGLVVQALAEAGIEVSLMMDNERAGNSFMGKEVFSLAHALLTGHHKIVVTSVRRAKELREALMDLGVPASEIIMPKFCEG